MGFNVEHWWHQKLEYPTLLIWGGGGIKKERWQLGTLLVFLKILTVYFAIADRNAVENTVTQQHLAYSASLFPLYISIDLKLLWPRESLFYSVYYIIKMMKFGVNREEGRFLSENFLPWTFCPRYIQPGHVGAFRKCLMVCWLRPGQKVRAGNFSDTDLLPSLLPPCWCA